MASYKFRVLLDNEHQEEIFRDILIDENDHFESLYYAILQSFSFNGDQMASFYMSNDNWDKGHEISLMDMNYGDESIDEKASIMSQALIRDFVQKTKQKMILVHDFMRMWIFLIECIEKINEKINTPKVVLSIGIAPLEDSKSSDFVLDSEIEEELDDEFNYDNEFDSDFEDGYDEEDYRSFEED